MAHTDTGCNGKPDRRKGLHPTDVGAYNPGIQRVEAFARQALAEHDAEFADRDPAEWQTKYSLLNHSLRSSEIMKAVGTARGRNQRSVRIGDVAALLHDIGKLDRSCHFYRRNVTFSKEERQRLDMGKHADISAEQVGEYEKLVRPEDRPFFEDVRVIARYHDEPAAIKDSGLRCICIDLLNVDTFVAITENRHRPGLPQSEAVALLEQIREKETAEGRYPDFCIPEIRESVALIKRLYGEKL